MCCQLYGLMELVANQFPPGNRAVTVADVVNVVVAQEGLIGERGRERWQFVIVEA